eukprot:438546-Prorocentrum_minimum.AAC.1
MATAPRWGRGVPRFLKGLSAVLRVLPPADLLPHAHASYGYRAWCLVPTGCDTALRLHVGVFSYGN